MNQMNMSTMISFNWQHTAVNNLPIDEQMIQEPREVRGCNYSFVETSPVDNPKIVSISSNAMMEALGVVNCIHFRIYL